MTTVTKIPRIDLIVWLIEFAKVTSDEGGMIQAVINRLQDDAEYKCTGGHDLCSTMLPGQECPTCEMAP